MTFFCILNKNNKSKGYVLIEIVLAFSITFALTFFLIDLVIKFKNKNDDLFISTLVSTDQAIVTNKIMKFAIDEEKDFTCKLNIENQKIVYIDANGQKNVIDFINNYASLENVECNNDITKGIISIKIPINVKQMKEKNFDVVINHKYQKDNLINLDVNGYFNGTILNNINGYGTFDVYIDGTLIKNDVFDYNESHQYGTKYEIKDIKALDGYKYSGVYLGDISGTIIDTTLVSLKYERNASYIYNGETGYGPTVTSETRKGSVYKNCGNNTTCTIYDSNYYIKWNSNNVNSLNSIELSTGGDKGYSLIHFGVNSSLYKKIVVEYSDSFLSGYRECRRYGLSVIREKDSGVIAESYIRMGSFGESSTAVAYGSKVTCPDGIYSYSGSGTFEVDIPNYNEVVQVVVFLPYSYSGQRNNYLKISNIYAIPR